MSRVTVTSAELQKHFGKYREIALTEPVSITSHGRDSVVLVSAAEYERLKKRDRQALYVWELGEEEIKAIENLIVPDEGAQFNHEVKT